MLSLFTRIDIIRISPIVFLISLSNSNIVVGLFLLIFWCSTRLLFSIFCVNYSINKSKKFQLKFAYSNNLLQNTKYTKCLNLNLNDYINRINLNSLAFMRKIVRRDYGYTAALLDIGSDRDFGTPFFCCWSIGGLPFPIPFFLNDIFSFFPIHMMIFARVIVIGAERIDLESEAKTSLGLA